MQRLLLCAVPLLAFGPALHALDEPEPDKPGTPAEEYRALTQEFDQAQREFFRAYQKARTDAERQKLFKEKYPRPEQYAKRFLQLAEKYPKDPAAMEALVWIASRVRSGPENDQAVATLFRDHLDSEKLGEVCSVLVYSAMPNTASLLRTAMEKSPHHAVKGQATYALASYFKRRRQNAEAEKLLEEVVAKYGDVKHWRGSLAAAAKGDLFELRHLAIGKPAPEIEGEDIDGVKFKLSDYRGKVVVLDFWGHW